MEITSKLPLLPLSQIKWNLSVTHQNRWAFRWCNCFSGEMRLCYMSERSKLQFFVKSDKQLRDQPWQKAPSGSSKPLTQWKHIQYRSKLSWQSPEPSRVSRIESRVSSIQLRVKKVNELVAWLISREISWTNGLPVLRAIFLLTLESEKQIIAKLHATDSIVNTNTL